MATLIWSHALPSLLFLICSFLNLNIHLSSASVTDYGKWSPAVATWYGNPKGAGNDNGGACLYGPIVTKAPLSSLVAAAGPKLFESGKGCGACYQVKCNKANEACSGAPVTVVITDLCPDANCDFDLSGTAFGAMAKPGQADQLRKAGKLHIEYARVACDYKTKKLTFRVDPGSNPWYFSVVVEYEDGDGEVSGLELQDLSGPDSSKWMPMQRVGGARWKLNSASELKGPFSLRLISGSGKKIEAKNVIPSGWKLDATYVSQVNI